MYSSQSPPEDQTLCKTVDRPTDPLSNPLVNHTSYVKEKQDQPKQSVTRNSDSDLGTRLYRRKQQYPSALPSGDSEQGWNHRSPLEDYICCRYIFELSRGDFTERIEAAGEVGLDGWNSPKKSPLKNDRDTIQRMHYFNSLAIENGKKWDGDQMEENSDEKTELTGLTALKEHSQQGHWKEIITEGKQNKSVLSKSQVENKNRQNKKNYLKSKVWNKSDEQSGNIMGKEKSQKVDIEKEVTKECNKEKQTRDKVKSQKIVGKHATIEEKMMINELETHKNPGLYGAPLEGSRSKDDPGENQTKNNKVLSRRKSDMKNLTKKKDILSRNRENNRRNTSEYKPSGQSLMPEELWMSLETLVEHSFLLRELEGKVMNDGPDKKVDRHRIPEDYEKLLSPKEQLSLLVDEKAEVYGEENVKAEVYKEKIEKAEVSEKTSKKAEVYEKTSKKAEVFEKTSKKAEVFEKTSKKAELTEKTSKKAELTEKTSKKAEVSQKMSKKAEVFEKTSKKAEVSHKTSKKAEVYEKTSKKAEVYENASEKAEVHGGFSKKAEVFREVSEKSEVYGDVDKNGKVYGEPGKEVQDTDRHISNSLKKSKKVKNKNNKREKDAPEATLPLGK